MTGQNAARHRITNWINPTENNRGPRGPQTWNWHGLGKSNVTLPQLLQRAGYRTIHIGKAHFGPWNSLGADPVNLGFSINIAGSPIGHPGSYLASKGYGSGTSHAVPHLKAFESQDMFLTAALTEAAKEQIQRAVAEKSPFFLNLAHYAVHSPFESDPRFSDDFQNTPRPQPAKNFATLISGIDHSLGQILDHLDTLKIADQTLILFLGDNGSDAPLGGPHEIACAAPLRGKKGSHYEGGMRVPMIAAWARNNDQSETQRRWPITQGAIQSQVASVCDLLATMTEITGTPLPTDLVHDGHSLTRLFTGQTDPDRPQEFLMHYPHEVHRSNHFTVWRQDDWKLIYHYFPNEQSLGNQYQLFHLSSDPSESRDLSQLEPTRLKEMVQAMVRRLDNSQALYPENENGVPLQPQIPREPVLPTR